MAAKGDVSFSAVFDIKSALDSIKSMTKSFNVFSGVTKKLKLDETFSGKRMENFKESVNKVGKSFSEVGKYFEKFYKSNEKFSKLQTLIQKNKESFDKKDPMSEKNLKEKTKLTEKFGGAFEKVSMFTIAAGNVMSNAIMSGWGMLKQGLMESIPAIGQTFGMIQQTIFRNMAMPIAQTILPLLVKLMHWVRDNRTQFVRFGVMILEVFKFVGGAIKSFFQLVKTGFNAFNKSIGGIQISFDKVMKFFQLVMFKASILIAYILILIEPVIEKLGEAFGNIYYKAIKPFISGLSDAFGERITGSITRFIGLIDRVASMFLISTENLDGFNNSAYNLGYTIGSYLFSAIDGVISIVESFFEALSDPDGQIIALITTFWSLAIALEGVSGALVLSKIKLGLFNIKLGITNFLLNMNPFVKLATTIILVTTALWTLYKNWDKIVAYMDESFDVTNRWNKFKNDIVAGWNEISGRFKKWVNEVNAGWEEIKGRFNKWKEEVIISWEALWSLATNKWNTTKDGVIEGWEYIVGMFTFTIKKIRKFFKDLWDSALGWFNDFAEKLKSNAVWNWIVGKISQLRSDVSGLNNAMNPSETKKGSEEKDKNVPKDENLIKDPYPRYVDYSKLKKEQEWFMNMFEKTKYYQTNWLGVTTDESRRKALEIFNRNATKHNIGDFDFDMRAKGGYVSANTSYVVGEKGAELFTPNTSGAITPNHQLKPLLTAGGRKSESGNSYSDNRTVQIIIQGNNLNPDQIAREVERRLQQKPNYARDFFNAQTKYGGMG